MYNIFVKNHLNSEIIIQCKCDLTFCKLIPHALPVVKKRGFYTDWSWLNIFMHHKEVTVSLFIHVEWLCVGFNHIFKRKKEPSMWKTTIFFWKLRGLLVDSQNNQIIIKYLILKNNTKPHTFFNPLSTNPTKCSNTLKCVWLFCGVGT